MGKNSKLHRKFFEILLKETSKLSYISGFFSIFHFKYLTSSNLKLGTVQDFLGF